MTKNGKNNSRNKNARKQVTFVSGSGQSTSKALVLRPKASAALAGGTQISVSVPRKARKANTKRGKMDLPQFVIAQVDPFCPEAFGVKVPDDTTSPSSVAFSRDLVTLSTNATIGGAGAVFRFSSSAAIYNATPVTSTTWTFPALATGSSPVSNNGALATNFNLLRTAAFGIKLETRQSAFAAAGFVHIALVPDSFSSLSAAQPSYPTSVALMEYAPYYRRVPIADLIEDEITVPGKWTDSTGFRYINPILPDDTSLNSTFPAAGWLAIQIWVEAPVSITNVVDIEMIHHYEGLSQNSTVSGGTGGILPLTKAAPYSPAIMAATDHVVTHMEPIAVNREDEENTGTVWNDVFQLFGTGLQIASGIFPILGPASSLYNKIIR